MCFTCNAQLSRRSRLRKLSSDGLTGSELGISALEELTNLCFSHKISSSVDLCVADGGRSSTGGSCGLFVWFIPAFNFLPYILTGGVRELQMIPLFCFCCHFSSLI